MRFARTLRRTPTIVFALLAFLVLSPRPAPGAPPPAPGEGKLDWVRLTSGEWLAGEIKFLRNESLDFDSKKLDLLHLEWEDVLEVRCSRSLSYVFTGKRAAIGPAVIRDSVVRVQEAGKTRAFPLAELVSITAGQGSEWSAWSGNFSVGFVGRSGNTNQVDFNTIGGVRRDGHVTRFDLKYAGNFGELEGVRSVNNQLGSVRLDAFLSRTFFVTPGSLELYSDEFQNIARRTTLSAGAGVYPVRESRLEWFVQLGAGYVRSDYRSVGAGESSREDGAAFIPSTAFEWEPKKDVTLNLDYSASIGISDTDQLFHHFLAMLTIENLKIVDFNTSVTWDHVSNPVARSDGTVPRKDDLRTAFGIGIDF
jgi:putative salt-induced outer membrane protein YdiY